MLDGQDIRRRSTEEVATIGLLPQESVAPEGITVGDLVGRGRHPHHGCIHSWTAADDRIAADALAATGSLGLAER